MIKILKRELKICWKKILSCVKNLFIKDDKYNYNIRNSSQNKIFESIEICERFATKSHISISRNCDEYYSRTTRKSRIILVTLTNLAALFTAIRLFLSVMIQEVNI